MKIGFIGLGIMGRPMALNLRAAGHELVVPERRSLTQEMRAAADVVADAAAVAERADVEALNTSMKGNLEKAGMVFNAVDTAPFRAKLSSAGFYKSWHAKYGDEAWAVLEKAAGGKLA